MIDLLGADVLTGGGSTDSDLFAYNSLGESLLGSGNSFDVITDLNNSEISIAGLLSTTLFAANSVAAFSASGRVGTLNAMNGGRDGFQADSDAIVFLKNYTLSTAQFVDFA